MFAARPYCSTTSTSTPLRFRSTSDGCDSSQNAGHVPAPTGNFARISKYPYRCEKPFPFGSTELSKSAGPFAVRPLAPRWSAHRLCTLNGVFPGSGLANAASPKSWNDGVCAIHFVPGPAAETSSGPLNSSSNVRWKPGEVQRRRAVRVQPGAAARWSRPSACRCRSSGRSSPRTLLPGSQRHAPRLRVVHPGLQPVRAVGHDSLGTLTART